jgi:hypothetical protein
MNVGEAGARPRLGMLRETYDLALEAAGDVWPTPAMALGNLFERGVAFVEGGGSLPPIRGAAPDDLLRALNDTREELLIVEAQYAFTKYVTFVLTRESEELEATWLALADRHLATRAKIVACRREEERVKRELSALGGHTVPLPEHDELPATPPDRPRKSRGMYAGLFEGVSAVEAELEVDPPTLAAADRLAREHGWGAEWGAHARLVIFAQGLSLALREREAESIDAHDPGSVEAARGEARGRLMGLEGRYATLRYRLFELRHGNRILGWRITALRVEAEGMRSRLELFEQDRARLQEEVAARRAALGPDAPPSTGHGQAESSAGGGWRARLARLLTPPGRDP